MDPSPGGSVRQGMDMMTPTPPIPGFLIRATSHTAVMMVEAAERRGFTGAEMLSSARAELTSAMMRGGYDGETAEFVAGYMVLDVTAVEPERD